MTNNITANKPSHFAYLVENYESKSEKKSNWTQIGSAWPHSDGKGFNIKLKSMPIDGNITIRAVKEESSSIKS